MLRMQIGGVVAIHCIGQAVRDVRAGHGVRARLATVCMAALLPTPIRTHAAKSALPVDDARH